MHCFSKYDLLISLRIEFVFVNPLNAKLNHICHLLALLGAHHIFHVSGLRVNLNEELNDLYSSPNIVWVIKSRRMRWAGCVARMGEERRCIGSWWGNRRERDHWGDLGVDGWIILGRISRRWDVGTWTGLGWPSIGTCGRRFWVR